MVSIRSRHWPIVIKWFSSPGDPVMILGKAASRPAVGSVERILHLITLSVVTSARSTRLEMTPKDEDGIKADGTDGHSNTGQLLKDCESDESQ